MSSAYDLVTPDAGDTERAAEAALRPRHLEDFVGQLVVREQLSLVLEAAIARGKTPDHVLLSGPPGLGKTTLSMIIANEVGGALRLTSGPAIQHPGDLAAVLSSLQEGDVLFIDEIHRLARTAEEMLYLAMEDFRVDVMVGKGPGATSIPLPLPPFTVVGATTRAGLLPEVDGAFAGLNGLPAAGPLAATLGGLARDGRRSGASRDCRGYRACRGRGRMGHNRRQHPEASRVR